MGAHKRSLVNLYSCGRFFLFYILPLSIMSSLFLAHKQRSLVWWGISIIAGLAMLYYLAWMHGVPKLQADPGLVSFFTDTIGFGVVAMYVAGIAETFGPILMLHWKTSFWGALLVLVNSLTASYVVYSLGNGFDTKLVVIIVVTAIVAWMMRPGFLRKAPEVTTVSV
jgi:hypothetical protein